MAKSVAIRCPNCGASSFEDSGGGERSCRYCRTTFRVAVPSTPKPARQFPPPPPEYKPPSKPLIVMLGQAVFTVFAAAIFIYFLISFFSMRTSHKEFDKRFEERRQEFEEQRKDMDRRPEGWPW
jgi:hypothetical protein